MKAEPSPTFENVDLRDQMISLQEEKKAIAIELENLKIKFVEAIVDVSIVAGKRRIGVMVVWTLLCLLLSLWWLTVHK